MEQIKLDVVADLWDLADIVSPILLDQIVLNFLPAFELHEVWLAIAVDFVTCQALIYTDTDVGIGVEL